MIRKILCDLGSIFLISLFLLTNTQALNKSNESLDQIVATVNDAVITQSELDEAIHQVKKQLINNHAPMPKTSAIQKRVLDQLIERRLQLQMAEQAGIQVSSEEVNKVIAGIASQNKMTEKELYQKLSAEGMNEDAYNKEIRDELTIQRIQQQEIGSHIVVSPTEVEDFLRSASWRAYNNKEYHLEDILIALPETPSPQDVVAAKNRANKVLANIRKGMSFREVAATESSDSRSLQGGDMGWLKLPQIPPTFANELIHMKANSILGPVATPNGFHIVRLVEVRDVAAHGDAAAQRKQVEQLLFQRKFEEGLQTWLTRMRSQAYITLNLENAQ